MKQVNYFLWVLCVLGSPISAHLKTAVEPLDCLTQIYSNCPGLKKNLYQVPDAQARILLGLFAMHPQELAKCPELSCVANCVDQFEACVVHKKRALLEILQARPEDEQLLIAIGASPDYERSQYLVIMRACQLEANN